VLQVVASLRGEEPAALAAATSRNARALFGLD
jgi:Tat protein secretion system quality control protein TatD with DNase activity